MKFALRHRSEALFGSGVTPMNSTVNEAKSYYLELCSCRYIYRQVGEWCGYFNTVTPDEQKCVSDACYHDLVRQIFCLIWANPTTWANWTLFSNYKSLYEILEWMKHFSFERCVSKWSQQLWVRRPISLSNFHSNWLDIIPFLIIRSLQSFAHATTAQLSRHVQNSIVINSS